MTKTGPNDARRVIQALGESFSIAFVLFDTKQISIAYTGSKLQNPHHPKRYEARDASHLELQVIHYHLTPLSSTGQAGASQAQVSLLFVSIILLTIPIFTDKTTTDRKAHV